MNININDLKNIHTARGMIYNFIRKSIVTQPDKSYYEFLIKILPTLEEFSNHFRKDNINQAINNISLLLKKRNSLKGDKLEEFDMDLLRNYTSLICIPNVVPQEESYYTSKDNLSGQEANDIMASLLMKYDLDISSNVSLYYDDIAVELSFMSHLAYLSADKVNEDNVYKSLIKEQYDFHINHFDKWIYTYFDRILLLPQDSILLIPNIVLFAKEFIAEDKQFLEEIYK